jgi:hypothetical protein
MTQTTVRPATGADVRRSSRWFAAVLLPVGPAAIAVLRYVLPYDTVDSSSEMASKVLAEPGRMSLVLWLSFVGMLALVPGALFVGRLTRRRAPRLTIAALLLLVPGYLVLPWLGSGDLIFWSGANAGVDVATLTTLYDAAHPTVEVAGVVFVLGHVVGTVLLGLALWRTRVVPRWAAVLVLVSQPLHAIAALVLVSHALDLAAWGMQAVGFAAVGWAILHLSDDEWDLPPLT